MQVTGLHHLGYVVPRIGPAITRFIEDGARLVVEPVDDPIQRVTVALLATDADVPIELVAPAPNVDGPIRARLRRGGGLDHLCYSVTDVAETLAEESARGSLIVCEPVFAIAFTRTVGFVQRRTGMVVEYISVDETARP
jgi:methylmalonyl-CoA/ethylmalonyl-CoA epimerase